LLNVKLFFIAKTERGQIKSSALKKNDFIAAAEEISTLDGNGLTL